MALSIGIAGMSTKLRQKHIQLQFLDPYLTSERLGTTSMSQNFKYNLFDTVQVGASGRIQNLTISRQVHNPVRNIHNIH